jgi:hypothetical protein
MYIYLHFRLSQGDRSQCGFNIQKHVLKEKLSRPIELSNFVNFFFFFFIQKKKTFRRPDQNKIFKIIIKESKICIPILHNICFFSNVIF